MIDKSKFKDKMSRMITQGLFIETKYDQDMAVFTLEDEDKTYKGEVYPSLKRLFLEAEDPTEYIFAKKHLLGWDHWLKLNGNMVLKREFDKWREELEVSIRSTAVQSIMEESTGDKGFQAAKWLADGKWNQRGPGRPSKDEVIKRQAIENRVKEDFDNDFNRMNTDGTVAPGSLQ